MKLNSHEDFNLSERIDYGVRKGVAKAFLEHKLTGHSIVVWKNGKIVEIPADEIEIPEEFRDTKL